MTAHNALSIEFLDSQAKAAASVLQSLDPLETAAYLEDVPIRTLVPVLASMETWPAASLLRHLSPGRCAALLRELGYQQAAALLRMQDGERRKAILAELPGRLARSFSQSLAYQDNTVGAWMDMNTPYFKLELSVADCLKLLSGQQRRFGSTLVVVDDKRRVQGVVELDMLLVSRGSSNLAKLVDRRVQLVSADMSLQVVKNLDAWHRYSALPVRDRNGVFLGTLTRVGLSDALARDRETGTDRLDFSLVGHLARALATTCLGLLHMESGSRIDWEADSREREHGH